ncbi:hypothetical protein FKM82_022985 [Ascaphus truei]
MMPEATWHLPGLQPHDHLNAPDNDVNTRRGPFPQRLIQSPLQTGNIHWKSQGLPACPPSGTSKVKLSTATTFILYLTASIPGVSRTSLNIMKILPFHHHVWWQWGALPPTQTPLELLSLTVSVVLFRC